MSLSEVVESPSQMDPFTVSTSTDIQLPSPAPQPLQPKYLNSDLYFQNSAEVWKEEKKCLLMLLEARMLLRELVEHKLNLLRILSGNLSPTEIQALLKPYTTAVHDTDFIADIQELRRQLVKEVRTNQHLERTLSKLESRIALLIQNRTSIQEIDRQIKRKRQLRELSKTVSSSSVDFTLNKKLMEGYSNFFYALQVEPKYLAKIAYVIPGDKTDQFVELILLTLYGDAYSPREEYLILQLFEYAMEYEMKHLRNVADFIQSDTVVPKMVLTYNKRKQGIEYIKNSFTSLFTRDIMVNEYQFEMKPLNIYQGQFTNDESGANITSDSAKKTKQRRDITKAEAAQMEYVQNVIKQRAEQLECICNKILECAIDSLSSFPYGLRLICKHIRSLILARFPSTKPDMILQVIGYFVYYRFIGLAIVAPDSFDIGERNLSPAVRKNLISVSKVLFQLMFRLSIFSVEDELAPLNPWIQAKRKTVIDYYSRLVDVPSPEDYLKVNQYMELTQKTKPIIIISLSEIVMAHDLVKQAIESVVQDENDPLRVIINKLGNVPPAPAGSFVDRDIQLQLENGFETPIDYVDPDTMIYDETKELVIKLFKVIQIKSTSSTLKSLIKSSAKFAAETNDKPLKKVIDRLNRNIETLLKNEIITRQDEYASLLKDVAIEVVNRAERHEAQQKEVLRLKATLKSLKHHQDFMNNQLSEFEKYLESCRNNSAARAKIKSKPLKFSFKELVKRRVIIDSNSLDMVDGAVKLFISMSQVGIFDVEAKFGPTSIAKARLELDELLERKENNVNIIEIDQICLSVPNTIDLINKMFLS